MIVSGLAHKYALGLFLWSREAQTLEKTEEEFSQIYGLINEAKTLQVLTHPLISKKEKKEIMLEIGKGFSKEINNLLKLLVDKNLIQITPNIFQEFQHLAHNESGIQVAEVTSAVELADKQKEAIAAVLEKRIGKKIRLVTRIDEKVVGGIVARIGDTVIDASIAGTLKELKEHITSPGA